MFSCICYSTDVWVVKFLHEPLSVLLFWDSQLVQDVPLLVGSSTAAQRLICTAWVRLVQHGSREAGWPDHHQPCCWSWPCRPRSQHLVGSCSRRTQLQGQLGIGPTSIILETICCGNCRCSSCGAAAWACCSSINFHNTCCSRYSFIYYIYNRSSKTRAAHTSFKQPPSRHNAPIPKLPLRAVWFQ